MMSRGAGSRSGILSCEFSSLDQLVRPDRIYSGFLALYAAFQTLRLSCLLSVPSWRQRDLPKWLCGLA